MHAQLAHPPFLGLYQRNRRTSATSQIPRPSTPQAYKRCRDNPRVALSPRFRARSPRTALCPRPSLAPLVLYRPLALSTTTADADPWVVHLATSLHLAALVTPHRPISSYLPARSSSFRLAFRPALVVDACARRARARML